MTHKDTLIYGIDEIDQVIEKLYLLLPKYKIFAFSGDLGTGKTTLIKKILKKCGIKEVITSPTFNYVNNYLNSVNENFYHFDLYRIKDLETFQELGFQEFLNKNNSWCFIEWPKIINNILNKKVCFIYLEYYNIDKRKLVYEIK